MFNLTPENLSAQRNNRVSAMLESLVTQTAMDLRSQETNREVAIPALCRIVTAVLPNTGKGHAATIKAQVNTAVDAAIEALNAADEPAEQEEQPQPEVTEEPEQPAKGKKEKV